MSVTPSSLAPVAPLTKTASIAALTDQLNQIILGKPEVIELAVACVIAGGHLLLEDLPGMGKTTLAQALACSLGLQFARVQFTADLLPADILGAAVFDRRDQQFVFHPGPVFTQVLLADEVNRATPKTQSALLEAMAEQQVSIEGETRHLPQPFFVIATQNPQHQIGTYPLPESQLDRFLMRLSLGFPDLAQERELLAGGDRAQLLRDLPAVLSPAQLLQWQADASRITVAPKLLDYIQALLAATRSDAALLHGLSTRAGLALLQAARSFALVKQRRFVLPDDVQSVLLAVTAHRLQARDVRVNALEVMSKIMHSVPVPT